MEKELIKLERVSNKISKLLQTEYDLDEFSADTYATFFLQTNFQKVKPSKWSKVKDFFMEEACGYSWDRKTRLKTYLQRIGITLCILTVLGLVIFGFSRLPSPFTYKAVVSDTYQFPNETSWGSDFSQSGIVITTQEGDSFNQQIREMHEGETVQMRTARGMLLNVTKKNHQIWLERVEE